MCPVDIKRICRQDSAWICLGCTPIPTPISRVKRVKLATSTCDKKEEADPSAHSNLWGREIWFLKKCCNPISTPASKCLSFLVSHIGLWAVWLSCLLFPLFLDWKFTRESLAAFKILHAPDILQLILASSAGNKASTTVPNSLEGWWILAQNSVLSFRRGSLGDYGLTLSEVRETKTGSVKWWCWNQWKKH